MAGPKNPVAGTDISRVRARLLGALDEYNRLSGRMTDYENMFLTLVLLPGLQLKQSIKKRETLERECHRIREMIKRNAYDSPDEIGEDVKAVLKGIEVEHFYQELDAAESELQTQNPAAGVEVFDPEDQLDETERARVLREFKRVVIPRIHADTSDAPFEVFNTVYAAYKKRDFLLMRAFIAQYRGEPAREPNETEETFSARAAQLLLEYQDVLDRLERRVQKLKNNMTAKEIEGQDAVLRELRNQSKEIQRAIYEEAERILHLRRLLERLASGALTIH